MTLHFDEAQLVAELTALSLPRRVAFATLVAERLLPGLTASRNDRIDSVLTIVHPIVDGIWQRLSSPEPNEPTAARRGLATCMKLVAENADKWAVSHPFAEDAVAAVAYALRCEATGLAQEAVYAARRGYEAIDKYIVDSSMLDLNRPGTESRILADPRVQSELAAQLTDLKALRSLTSPDRTELITLRDTAIRGAHAFLGERQE